MPSGWWVGRVSVGCQCFPCLPLPSPATGGKQGSVPPAGQGGRGSGVGGEAGWRGRAGTWGDWSPHWSWSEVGGHGGAALASVGLRPECFRVGARTPFRAVSGRATAPAACSWRPPPGGCKGTKPCSSPPGTATSPEQKPASAYSQLGQAAPGIFIQPLHHKYSSMPAERNLGSLGKPTPSSRRASSCRQQD